MYSETQRMKTALRVMTQNPQFPINRFPFPSIFLPAAMFDSSRAAGVGKYERGRSVAVGRTKPPPLITNSAFRRNNVAECGCSNNISLLQPKAQHFVAPYQTKIFIVCSKFPRIKTAQNSAPR